MELCEKQQFNNQKGYFLVTNATDLLFMKRASTGIIMRNLDSLKRKSRP